MGHALSRWSAAGYIKSKHFFPFLFSFCSGVHYTNVYSSSEDKKKCCLRLIDAQTSDFCCVTSYNETDNELVAKVSG